MDLKFLQCPLCTGELINNNQEIHCISCHAIYAVVDKIPVFLSHANNEEKNPDVWDEIWSQSDTTRRYEILIKKQQLYLELTKILDRPFEHVTIKNPTVIELGCGGSLFFSFLQKKYLPSQIWGIDRSLEASQLLERHLDGNLSSTIICGDILHSPLKQETFDVVCSFGFIEHFNNPQKALDEHIRLLKPGGLLLCLIPNLYGLPGKILNFIESETITTISREDVKNWLCKKGLEEITVQPIGGLMPTLFLDSFSHMRKNTKEMIIKSLHNCCVNPLSITLNVFLLFRMNSLMFSPFIIAYGKKPMTGG